MQLEPRPYVTQVTCFERPRPGARTAAQATAENLSAGGGRMAEAGGGAGDNAGGGAGGGAGELSNGGLTESDGSDLLGLRLEEGGVLAVLRARSLQFFTRGAGSSAGAGGGAGGGAGSAGSAAPEASARSAALQKALEKLEAEEDW